MNKVMLVGRITKDPELKKTQTDISVVQFTLAVNRLYQNKNGERVADFINCVAWRATADLLARYIRKGNQIGIEGSIQTRTYDDQNGIRRYITEVVCDNVHFLEPKRQSEDGYSSRQDNAYSNYDQSSRQNYQNQSPKNDNNSQQSKKQESPFENVNSDFNISDDDLPF